MTPASPPSASTPARGTGELRGSIPTRKGASLARRFFVFLGPGYLVATGYMDPGNWATALAAGSRYGCALLFAAVLSSLMAIVLQALSARLGLASGLDLAQACRARFSKPATIALWLVAEAAIAATDLAEIIGTAIGLQLLFGMPLAVGIAVTLLDTFVVLAFERAGFRKIELFVVSLFGLIAFSFTAQLAMAHVDLGQVARGLVPTRQLLDDPRMLYLGLGIVGATVMPHNLFLHSSIVLTRAVGASPAEKREAIGFALIDSAVALFFALLVNGAILVLAASVFYASGHVEVTELSEAHRLIAPLLGAPLGGEALRHRADRLRPQLDGHGDALRTDRDGGLRAPSHDADAAAAVHAADRGRPRRGSDADRRRGGDGRAAGRQPGRAELHLAFRDGSADLVHGLAPRDGRAYRAAPHDRARRDHRRGHHRAERQADFRRAGGLSPGWFRQFTIGSGAPRQDRDRRHPPITEESG